MPYARYMPQYKLGRWDGKVGFFGLGGSGYVNHLNTINDVLSKYNVEIVDIEDRRHPVDLNFTTIKEDFWGDKTWPKGHPAEGETIRLRDYQVEVINNFFKKKIICKIGIHLNSFSMFSFKSISNNFFQSLSGPKLKKGIIFLIFSLTCTECF